MTSLRSDSLLGEMLGTSTMAATTASACSARLYQHMDLLLEELLQYCLWRCGIEVNFREEKTLIGTGEAQVRTAALTELAL